MQSDFIGYGDRWIYLYYLSLLKRLKKCPPPPPPPCLQSPYQDQEEKIENKHHITSNKNKKEYAGSTGVLDGS